MGFRETINNWRDGLIGKAVDQRVAEKVNTELAQRSNEQLGGLNPTAVSPRSMFFDPLSLVSQTQYKERYSSLTYDVLANMAEKTEQVNAIINTRIAQVGSFAQPARWKKNSLGFQIRFKDANREPTKSERERLDMLEDIFYQCGYTDRYRSGERRPNFGEFLKRFLRDSLIYDQACFEVIPARNGKPCEWWAVDASTIRIAQPRLIKNLEELEDGRDITKYVQVYNNVVRHTYTYRELAFCVRNIRNSIKHNGYGYSELEMLINMITSVLFAQEYNRRFFSNGSMINGLLNIKGANVPQEMLESFRRQWHALASNVTNAHKIPVLTSKEGIEFINLHSNNRDMEYNSWIEYLVKMVTAVYLIDPAEINFDYRGASESAPLFETSPEAKLKHSRDKGLRNLLNFIEEQVNYHILHPIDRNLYFEFTGIDMKDEQEMVNIRASEVQAYKKLNEVRKEAGLEPYEDEEIGNLILNPVVVNYKLQQQAQQQQQQMMEAQAGQGGQGGAAPAPEDPNEFAQGSASLHPGHQIGATPETPMPGGAGAGKGASGK